MHWRGCMREVIEHPDEAERRTAAGKRYVLENMSLERRVAAFQNIYRSCFDAHSGPLRGGGQSSTIDRTRSR